MKHRKSPLIFSAAALGIVLVVTLSFLGIRQWRTNAALDQLASPELKDGLLEEPISKDGEEWLVPPNDVYSAGLTAEQMPAIDDPKFVSVAVADQYLADDVYGVDVEIDGDHRFYSYQILNWHEVVNDEFNGTRIAVTHCTLCRSAVAYLAALDGETRHFEISGSVYNNNALLRDRETGTLWLQLRGKAVSGSDIGKELERVPFTIMTWEDWKERYPEGEALSTETGYDRDYTRHPYTSYDTAKTLYFPLNSSDDRLSPKWDITGATLNGEQVAFSDRIMEGMGSVNGTLGGVPMVGLWDEDLGYTRVFERSISEEQKNAAGLASTDLTFSFHLGRNEIKDDQTGTLWNIEGVAIEGPLEGAVLTRVPVQKSFWFCWSALYPETKVGNLENEDKEDDDNDQETDE